MIPLGIAVALIPPALNLVACAYFVVASTRADRARRFWQGHSITQLREQPSFDAEEIYAAAVEAGSLDAFKAHIFGQIGPWGRR